MTSNRSFLLLKKSYEYLLYSQIKVSGFVEDPLSILPDSVYGQGMDNDTLMRNLVSSLEGGIRVDSSEDKCSIVSKTIYTSEMTRILETLVIPILLSCAVLVNIIVSILLTRKSMQSASNSILLGIALCDLFSSMMPIPFGVIQIFYPDLLIKSVSVAYFRHYFTFFFPTLFHTMAVWLTILLAVQRYYFVCRPIQANRCAVCKQKPVQLMIFCTFIVSVLIHLQNLLTTSFYYGIQYTADPSGLPWSVDDLQSFKMKISVYKCTYETAQSRMSWLMVRTILVHVGPSFVLVVFTVFLVFALNRIAKKRKKLLNNKAVRKLSIFLASQQQKQSVCENESKTLNANIQGKKCQLPSESSDSISKMMIVVLVLFLVGEIPTTIQIAYYTINTFFIKKRIDTKPMIAIANTFLVSTYPANFFIYYIMSKNFRDAFKVLIGRLKRSQRLI